MNQRSVVVAVSTEQNIQEPIQRAIELAGGIEPKVNTVLIKPNVVFGLRPNTGTVTNPLVIEGIIKYLVEKGIEPGNITIGECSAMGCSTKKAFKISGFSNMCNRHGVNMVEFFEEEDHITKEIKYRDEQMPIEIAREVFENDLLINVPVIKTHFQSGISMALKNMFGTASWDSRKALHKIGLANGIAYLNTVLPRYFTVGDASIGLQGKGPTLLGKPGNWNLLFASMNPVAHDSAICNIFGLDIPEHVRISSELGLGNCDIKNIEVIGERMECIKRIIEPATKDISPIKNVEIMDGDACSYCLNYVWTVLFKLSKDGTYSNELEVFIGNLIKDCKSGKKRFYCGDCAIKHKSLPGRTLPGCPPKMSEIMKVLMEI